MQTVLGDLSIEDFLANYWQQKPLVIRGAFADFEMPFDAGELAGLACEMDTPARIIIEKVLAPDFKPWTAKHAPFTDEDFTSLPETHWSFLVNDLEKYYPELGNLIEPFRFIPDWRIDDLMVSYAADQGSVGPHIDKYDVFLIQGEGKRRWQVITREDFPKALNADASLPTLQEFDADEEWLLEAGDMLYLPPNVPHHGIAEGECFTFSVGFRAPNTLDLTQSWIESFSHIGDHLSGNNDDNQATALLAKHFTDAGRKIQQNPGEITAEDIQKLSEQILSLVRYQEQQLPVFLGKYLTETRGVISLDEDHDAANKSGTIENKLIDSSDYERESWLRLAYIESPDAIHLFADGNHLALPLTEKKSIQELCENYYYSAESLQSLMQIKPFRDLFQTLLNSGSLYLCS
jgi:50S ribosomal protein L16 3-hydroxylase